LAIKKKMFLGAGSTIFENARVLRENPTVAEMIYGIICGKNRWATSLEDNILSVFI
jgi:hypothetical protein